MVTDEKEKDNSGKKWLFLSIIIILLLINAIQLYLQNQARKEIQEKVVVIENKDAEIKVYNYKLDSIQRELQYRYEEIAKLGGDTASMGDLIRQLKRDKKSLAANAAMAQAKYNEIKSQYDQVMTTKDSEIETLRAERDDLFKANNELKKQQVSLNDSISELKSKKEELSKQVEIAAQLKVADLKITYISKKDKEITSDTKAKKVAKLKVAFNVLENKVAKIESKIFYLRVIEPDGAALYDLAQGGGSIQFDGKEIYYTAKQEILYDQMTKTLTFIYNKGAEYKQGKHQIEVYCENAVIGRGVFTLL
ncbi:MAG: hypothetical protein SFY32_06435 [Bacteroidota bacterium]|nr:hypothetical protein [Bacteroidota bacterium]